MKTYEQYINPDDTFDNNGKFIYIHSYESRHTYRFVWNLRMLNKKKVYHCDSIGFTEEFGGVRLESLNKNETFEFYISTSRIEPDKFYEKNPKLCLDLYNIAKQKIDDFPEMASFRKMKYEKLINTLYSIEDLRLEIEMNKYNL